ncbi:MAG: (d)CMP kinase [Alicyclobacillus macrosporangiidus]|uniref:(d)CMP kinase n=1 Tax=Alicyclobacillus macrosporangiidus TaxID=392015 RepID=UPI0026F03F62|nr:(d)CMP kinase [Alicyclobacillus macrosporangiidus]MCL6598432.1 (d)CMP kinase [Alicyclobacillus macrosporangiidus]
MRHISIAIDGPAGAGKSTVARRVAKELGILYVDTGAMYRGVAWLAVQHHVSPEDERALLQLLREHSLRFEYHPSGELEVIADGQVITPYLRDPEVSETVSKLSVHPGIRNLLTEWQREFAQRYPVVMDGRDVGTVVLPNAQVKVFLTASIEERAKRRQREFTDKGFDVSLQEMQQAIAERDARDASRSVAPLRPADDAYFIDSTGKSVEDIVEEILSLVERVPNE